jgi:hypothetical protein
MKQPPAPTAVSRHRPARSTGGGGGGGGGDGGAAATAGSGGGLAAQPASAAKTNDTAATFAACLPHCFMSFNPTLRNNQNHVVGSRFVSTNAWLLSLHRRNDEFGAFLHA